MSSVWSTVRGKRVRSVLWVAVSGIVLAGCTEFQPVHWGGAVPWEEARKAIYSPGDASRVVPSNGRHVVMPGETVSELAVTYRVAAADIIALNDLERPYFIYVGQVLRLPQPGQAPSVDGRTHVVARGDTLSEIAAAHNVRLGDLIALNRDVDPKRLYVGTRLRLPAASGTMVAGTTPRSGAPAARPAARVAEAPRAPAVAAARPSQSPTPAAAPTAEATVRVSRVPPPAAAPRDVAMAQPSSAERDAARQRNLAAVEAPPLTGESFLWPLDAGEVISAFGTKPDGRRNDGINIAAPAGSVVRAAENGIVVYADEDLAAFGRMLLVRHADGYLTAYAHNDALLVTRGDIVRRGQPIAKVGRTGEVAEPQLHFEIRRGKGAVDPVALLGQSEVRLASRD